MSLVFISSFTMLILVTYLSIKKHLHIYEQFLVLFLLIFLYTTFLSVTSVNIEVWKLSKDHIHLIAYRMYGIVFLPFTILWFINLWHDNQKTKTTKVLFLFLCLSFLFTGDYILRVYDVYQYNGWNQWMSIAKWILLIMISLIIQKFYRNLLRKEGII